MKPKITGIHHVALNARGLAAYERLYAFYHDLLGLPLVRQWGEGENIAVMLDTGAGMLELFAHAKDEPGQGALRHLAFAVEDVDACVEAVRAAGYKITDEPHDVTIPSTPPCPVRIAFCIGPVGEEIEFFTEKQ